MLLLFGTIAVFILFCIIMLTREAPAPAPEPTGGATQVPGTPVPPPSTTPPTPEIPAETCPNPTCDAMTCQQHCQPCQPCTELNPNNCQQYCGECPPQETCKEPDANSCAAFCQEWAKCDPCTEANVGNCQKFCENTGIKTIIVSLLLIAMTATTIFSIYRITNLRRSIYNLQRELDSCRRMPPPRKEPDSKIVSEYKKLVERYEALFQAKSKELRDLQDKYNQNLQYTMNPRKVNYDDCKDLKNDFNKLRERQSTLKSEYKELLEQNRRLLNEKNTPDEKDKQIEKLQQLVNTLQEELQQKQPEQEKEAPRGAAPEEVKHPISPPPSTEQYKALERQNRLLISQNSDLQQLYKGLNDKYTRLESNNSNQQLQRTIQSLEQQLRECEAAMASQRKNLQEQEQRYSSALDQKNRENEQLRQQLDAAKRPALVEEKLPADATSTELWNRLQHLQQQYDDCIKTNDYINKGYDELSNDKKKLESENRQLQNQIERINREKDDCSTELKRCHNDLDRSNQQIQALTLDNRELQRRLNDPPILQPVPQPAPQPAPQQPQENDQDIQRRMRTAALPMGNIGRMLMGGAEEE